MIVYNENKGQFVQDVRMNVIATKILDRIREKGLNAGQDREFASWQNSMQFMRNIVDDSDIDDDVQIAIEYNIPQTSKRVDFIIVGSNDKGKDNIVIVELKQWTKAEVVDDDMHFCVRTYVANDKRIVCHPSYQAYSYSRFMVNYSQDIHDRGIHIVPCAYLHNYLREYRQALSNKIYEEWYTTAPFFIMDEVKQFSDFVKKFVTRKSANGDLLYLIDHGRIKPTKSLQDALATMVKGTPVFDLLDEQAVCFDMCIRTMLQCLKDRKKRTIIIQGGPGTGKSVLAVNLLMHFITCACNAAYVTKNSAPRQAFLSILTGNNAMKLAEIRQLFRSPFGMFAISVSQVSAHPEGCTCPSCSPADYESLMDRSVRVCLAEAASSWLDGWLRERLLRSDLKVCKPAAGYASCPDHTLKRDILSMLPHGEELGISFTESYAMVPDASICGFIFIHKDASYPEIRHISDSQYGRYLKERGFSALEGRRFLGNLLQNR